MEHSIMKQQFNALSLRTALGITTAQYELVKPTLKLADGVSVTLAEQLLKHGIGDKTTARPFVVYYLAEVRKGAMALAYEGQRGITFGNGNKYERQVTRILSKIFDDVQAEAPAKKTSNKPDIVKALFTKWQALSASEKRRFTTLQLKAD
jgi:hypothetical protein